VKTYNELHRPQFHFSARENWINDPNGLVYVDGVWHLFFQHNPEATIWGNMTWGHAVSHDLMHWRQLEHALLPDEHGTMFSGSAVVDHDNTAGFGAGSVLAFYTAAGDHVDPKRPYTQCLAYSNDGGSSWSKYDGNPIVESFEAGNRDPKVIWHPGSSHWIMALYLTANRYCLLRSKDARTWDRFQDLELEGVAECPDFFPLADESGSERWVFWGAKGIYRIGRFDGETFVPETDPLTCEHGTNGYAAQTWSNTPDGRCIQISWMAGGLYPEMPFNQQMSIPVELKLAGSGSKVRLTRWPVGEIETLRGKDIRLQTQQIRRGEPMVPATSASLLDVSFDVTNQNSKALHVVIRGQRLVLDWAASQIHFNASPVPKVTSDRPAIPLPGAKTLSLRLLIDKTSVEVFVNQGQMSASFCFLPDACINPLVLEAWDGEQTISHFHLHELTSVWEDSE
jgi:fructan beta-fructosidase